MAVLRAMTAAAAALSAVLVMAPTEIAACSSCSKIGGGENGAGGREAGVRGSDGGGGDGRGGSGGGGGAAGAAATAFDTVVVVDAGSSGCRLNVYRLGGEGDSLEFSGVAGGKIEPGLSSFADAPKDAAEYISPLLARASELVPPESHPATKVFIKSTAGMRMLPPETQEAIYDEIHTSLAGDPSFPFALERDAVGTIDGDMEAFFAVLSANFLAGRIDAAMRPTGHEAGEIGALDMGGASTQIIFQHKEGDREPTNHKATSHADGWGEVVPIIPGPVSQEDFWGASHLGFGVSEVRLRIWDLLVERHRSQLTRVDGASSGAMDATIAATAAAGVADEGDGVVVEGVSNPCSFVGRTDEWKGHRLVGSGDHSMCEDIVAAVLWGTRRYPGGEQEGEEEEGAARCGWAADEDRRACGVGGVDMPAPRGDFLAMSVFFYAMHAMHALAPAELPAWPTPTLSELREAAEGFCGMDWGMLQLRKDEVGARDVNFETSEEGLPHRCVEVVYMTTLLRDGYGFPEHSRNVTFALETNGMELEWTLGYALAELARARGDNDSAAAPIDLVVSHEGGDVDARTGQCGAGEAERGITFVSATSTATATIGGDGVEEDSGGSGSGGCGCNGGVGGSHEGYRSSSRSSRSSSFGGGSNEGSDGGSTAVANHTESGGDGGGGGASGGVNSLIAAAAAAVFAVGSKWRPSWKQQQQQQPGDDGADATIVAPQRAVRR